MRLLSLMAALSLSCPAFAQVRVIDGDSLMIAGQSIRLHGIDAVEQDQMCRSDKGWLWFCGRKATEQLRQIIGSRVPDCKQQGRDKYGRVLAVCHVEHQDIGGQMIEEGYAVPYPLFSNRYAGQYESAVNRRIGIHAGTFELPSVWRQRKRSER